MLRKIVSRPPVGWGAAACALLFLAGTAPAAAPTVTAVDAAGLKRAIAARKGKVVVVNFWATWCAPCVKEFPDLVRVARKYKARGVELITVSVDSPEDVKPKVVPFLTKQGVAAGAFVQKGKAEAFINGVDPNWQGDVPRTYIYDRSGKRVKTLEGEQSQVAFEKAIAPLVAK